MEDIKIGLKEIVADFDLSSSNEYNRGLAILCGDALNRLEQLEKENEKLEADNYSANCIISDQIDLLRDSIPKSKIKEKIEELKKYEELAKEQINNRIVIADSDSLNYGRAEAHSKDIQVLKELLGEEK